MGSVRGMVLAIAVLLFAAPLWGQTGTSAIRGTITDQQGRLVPNATVTLTNMATSAARTTKTTASGDFVFDLIPPGDYRVEVQATGFRSNVVNNVHALIGKQTESSVQLEVGAATEVVEVTASSQEALINTQDASLGNNFIAEQITQLPLEARNLVDLLSLQPGSTREGLHHRRPGRSIERDPGWRGYQQRSKRQCPSPAHHEQPGNWNAGWRSRRHHLRAGAPPQCGSD